jgi:hypothetical protein
MRPHPRFPLHYEPGVDISTEHMPQELTYWPRNQKDFMTNIREITIAAREQKSGLLLREKYAETL